jgi:hypothetical protein
MGSVDVEFARALQSAADLRRAVETGTFRGITARALAAVFDDVTTIELDQTLHQAARQSLGDLSNVTALQGHSAEVLGSLPDIQAGTLFFLDGHWSGGDTSGGDDQCPVLAELAAIGSGHVDDCFIVDDARFFTAAPPPPNDPNQWPTLMAVFDAIRATHPDHVVTVLDDQIIGVPPRAVQALNAYGQLVNSEPRALVLARTLAGMARDRARRVR